MHSAGDSFHSYAAIIYMLWILVMAFMNPHLLFYNILLAPLDT